MELSARTPLSMHGNSNNDETLNPKAPSPKGEERAQDSSQTKQPADALAAPDVKEHVRKLNLVGSSQITRAVAEAVRRGLSNQFVVSEAQLEGAVKAIGAELMKRLKANSKSVRGMPKDAFLREVREDKKRIEVARKAAAAELDTMLEKLKQSHEEVQRREEELTRESRESGQIHDQKLTARIAEIFAGGGAEIDAEAIRAKITELALGSLQGERDKSIEAQLTDHRTEVENFERRIAKLTSSLSLTEVELKRMAAAKNIDLGVGSVYRSVQGLSSKDEGFETKKELMSSIFAANLELQKGHAEAG
ncbi:MAG: hypothetical protein ACI8X5_004293 [Planctomycetota bacterium]|jgi:hypothetical protein